MRTISATEAKQSLGMIIDMSQREPVIIQRQHRDIAVLLSMHDYNRLKGTQLEAFNIFCEKIAQKAKERGLTEKKLEALLKDDSKQ
ncbi:MAG: prevent-host-death family protein [uncultured bacterium]|nr:MAG: prevent-host-death family protein [uncultured bacterium]OFW70071.1 MAG: prevent-host-death family protein [Alphaproteobacteria bacterium GWC2_42_16]OFW74571.1 MAG: prevent-host-death family protein [Alphaproteobacteria bacterium GWA2_41_27]OFW84843.1 MAG: prevent-host-death family protein [Alphaproteobacteria bacterium RIFCSPHIGHO2_12_FULL_42_100]OFW86568.1 MAG: prevent-host-death family protein [Alphaproteobacteria bacterium RBG_16_42_14]OFW90965.1 MAG: prevent-host-death family prote